MLNNSWQNIIYWRWKVAAGQWIDFYVDARIGNQDITNNRTQIYTKLRSVLSGGTAGGTGYKFTCSYAPTVEGSGAYYFGTKTITETNSEQYVQHNDDGSASVTIETTLYNGYLKLNKTLSATVSLPTIPRKSNVTATSATIGGACSININQKSDTFTHTLRYSFGNLNGTITTGAKYSYGWTVPNDFYSQIPNAPSGTATIYCDTYNGGTLIGTTSTTTIFSANENETKPSVSMSVKDINPITSQLTSGTNESTKIVKGFSNAQITWSSTPKQYASIKSNTINGTSVSESPYTFNNANTNIFTFVATDTRGFSNSISTTNTSNPLVDYVRLRIDPINFYRIKPTTGEVGLTFEGNYFNDTFGNTANTLELSFKSREKGSTTSWDSIESVSLEGGYYLEGNKVYSGTSSASRIIQLEGTFDYTKQYEFRFYYKDKLVDEYVDKSISYGQPIFWWNKDGVYDGKTNGKLATLDLVYPVGSIYMSVSDTSPQTLFGGTWEKLQGRFLIGTGSATDKNNDTRTLKLNQTGGEFAHTLTSGESGQKNLGNITTGNESQSHTHSITTGGYTYPNGSSPGAFSTATSNSTLAKDTDGYTFMTSESANHTHSFSIGGQDASQSHNNIPPYLAVNMWKRTA